MRKLIVAITTVALVAGSAWAVAAQTGGGRTPLDCMDTFWQTTPVSTTSTQWSPVPRFRAHPVAIFPITINVSALVSGAPVKFRILSTNVGEQTFVSKPGATRFVPGGSGSNSFNYQWIERNQSASPHAILLQLHWQSPSGNAVHLLRGDMSVLYTTDVCQGSS
ncbi:MAG TPA: hypothetical protein VGL18_07650 [Actinomycetota bacterium]